jgi:hypothetical protein
MMIHRVIKFIWYTRYILDRGVATVEVFITMLQNTSAVYIYISEAFIYTHFAHFN